MTPGAGSSELAPVFLCPLWGRKFSGSKYKALCSRGSYGPGGAANASGKQGRRAAAHLWGPVFYEAKNRAQNNPPHIGRGLWTPCGLGLWAGENRGLYSLEHGGAVIPPLCGMGQGQEYAICQAPKEKFYKSQEFTGVLFVLCCRREQQREVGHSTGRAQSIGAATTAKRGRPPGAVGTTDALHQ